MVWRVKDIDYPLNMRSWSDYEVGRGGVSSFLLPEAGKKSSCVDFMGNHLMTR